MKEVRYEFKCRRCGKISSDTGTSSSNALGYLMEVLMNKPVGTLDKWSICNCEDGGVGVFDIIGYNIK